MYFTVNTTFVNYLDEFPKSLEFPVVKERTMFEQTLPISLNISKFESNLTDCIEQSKRIY